MNKIQENKIRAEIMGRPGVQRVKITRNGEVHCYGNMPRGDGGKRPWWMFAGMVENLAQEMDLSDPEEPPEIWDDPKGCLLGHEKKI